VPLHHLPGRPFLSFGHLKAATRRFFVAKKAVGRNSYPVRVSLWCVEETPKEGEGGKGKGKGEERRGG
jgi:hypothetical protein